MHRLAAVSALQWACVVGSVQKKQFSECNRHLEDFYDMVDKPLGFGGFGIVSPAVHKETKEVVAVKSVNKSRTDLKKFKRETEIMRVIGEHQNVVQYLDHFDSEKQWHIVMERAGGGELFDRLVQRGPYTESQASDLIREITAGLAYIHQHRVVHFDLKPENILLSSKEKDSCDTRITDFGSAFYEQAAPKDRTLAPGEGTAPYLPPEAHSGLPCDSKADMWSLGVVMYILLAGVHPFDEYNDRSDEEIIAHIVETEVSLDGYVWDRVSDSAKDLLRSLLHKDPAKRPSATEVLDHAWVREETPDTELHTVSENLRRFQRGRWRLKALLLAVMLGLHHPENVYPEELEHPYNTVGTQAPIRRIQTGQPLPDRQNTMGVTPPKLKPPEPAFGQDPLGSRRAALKVFDPENKKEITLEDLDRVLRMIGVILPETELLEMVTAADANPFHTHRSKHVKVTQSDEGQPTIPVHEMLKLIPPLCPAQEFRKSQEIFKAGELDQYAYLVTAGDVLLTTKASKDAQAMPSRRVGRGDLIGDGELLEPDHQILPRLHGARCGSNFCKVLAVNSELFSHVTEVFDPLSENLRERANRHLKATLSQWMETNRRGRNIAVNFGQTAWPLGTGKKQSPSRLSDRPMEDIRTNGCLLFIRDGFAQVSVSDDPAERGERFSVGPGYLCYCAPQGTRGAHIPEHVRALPRCTEVLADSFLHVLMIPGNDFEAFVSQPGMEQMISFIDKYSK